MPQLDLSWFFINFIIAWILIIITWTIINNQNWTNNEENEESLKNVITPTNTWNW